MLVVNNKQYYSFLNNQRAAANTTHIVHGFEHSVALWPSIHVPLPPSEHQYTHIRALVCMYFTMPLVILFNVPRILFQRDLPWIVNFFPQWMLLKLPPTFIFTFWLAQTKKNSTNSALYKSDLYMYAAVKQYYRSNVVVQISWRLPQGVCQQPINCRTVGLSL